MIDMFRIDTRAIGGLGMDENKKKLLNMSISVIKDFCKSHEGPCRYCVFFDNICGGQNKDAYKYPCDWENID